LEEDKKLVPRVNKLDMQVESTKYLLKNHQVHPQEFIVTKSKRMFF